MNCPAAPAVHGAAAPRARLVAEPALHATARAPAAVVIAIAAPAGLGHVSAGIPRCTDRVREGRLVLGGRLAFRGGRLALPEDGSALRDGGLPLRDHTVVRARLS